MKRDIENIKPYPLFAALFLVIQPQPAYASEDNNPLRIENITSISSIVNPATLELARSVNAAPDGSRLLIESSTYRASRNEVFIAKLSGYDRIMSIRAPELIKNGEKERSPETTDIAAPAPQITESTTAATPKAPGFDAALAIGILFTINLFKRRYN